MPGLAVVIVGSDPASQVYVGAKGRTAEACGFHSVQHTLPAATTSETDLLALVAELNADPAIHGILVQLPLPKHIDRGGDLAPSTRTRTSTAFTRSMPAVLATGAHRPAFVPCTPAGAMLLMRDACGDQISGKHAVVLGRSNIVGKPMAQLLLAADCTVTVAHSRIADLPALCREADILVAAVGRPEMVAGDWIKPGAVVIDVGINRVPTRGRREEPPCRRRCLCRGRGASRPRSPPFPAASAP